MVENNSKLNNQENDVIGLASLFNLLAEFDYEDKQNPGINTDTLVSTIKVSVLGPEHKIV